jgi:hypothetical protein
MTTHDRNDLTSAPQEKLEWVTPKISLMGAERSLGKQNAACEALGHLLEPISWDPEPDGPCNPLAGRWPSPGDLLNHLCINPPTPAKANSTNGSAKTFFNGLEH